MQIPLYPGDISADWLTATLRAAGMLTTTRVSVIEIELLSSDKGTTSQFARLRLRYQGILRPHPPR